MKILRIYGTAYTGEWKKRGWLEEERANSLSSVSPTITDDVKNRGAIEYPWIVEQFTERAEMDEFFAVVLIAYQQVCHSTTNEVHETRISTSNQVQKQY